jgi:hypothetical protein
MSTTTNPARELEIALKAVAIADEVLARADTARQRQALRERVRARMTRGQPPPAPATFAASSAGSPAKVGAELSRAGDAFKAASDRYEAAVRKAAEHEHRRATAVGDDPAVPLTAKQIAYLRHSYQGRQVLRARGIEV